VLVLGLGLVFGLGLGLGRGLGFGFGCVSLLFSFCCKPIRGYFTRGLDGGYTI